jgi:hypothetical protein
LRIAQSLGSQAIEYIGYFAPFSSPPKADSWGSEKRDTKADSEAREGLFRVLISRANCSARRTC